MKSDDISDFLDRKKDIENNAYKNIISTAINLSLVIWLCWSAISHDITISEYEERITALEVYAGGIK